MNTNKVVLGGLAGAATFFILGFLVYGLLLKDYMAANGNQCIMKPEGNMTWWAVILSNLAIGFLVAVVFSWSNTMDMMTGAKRGAILGFLFSFSWDMMFYSMSTLYSNLGIVFVDVIAYTAMIAIAGAVVAMVIGRKKAV
jgi:hypothetical protein